MLAGGKLGHINSTDTIFRHNPTGGGRPIALPKPFFSNNRGDLFLNIQPLQSGNKFSTFALIIAKAEYLNRTFTRFNGTDIKSDF